MTTTGKLPPTPVLRTARQRTRRTKSGSTEWLEWYLCPAPGAFCHLLLLDGQSLLGHWVLPATQPPASAAVLLPGLWTQVPPTLALAMPSTTQAIGHGTCRLVGTTKAALKPTPGSLPTSQLLLHLPAAGSTGFYTLRQLRPGSLGWVLSKLTDPSQVILASVADKKY